MHMHMHNMYMCAPARPTLPLNLLQNTQALTPRPLQPSASVRAAVDAVAEALGGEYDAAHVRQSDKAQQQSNEKLLVPALSHRRLTQHLLALLPPLGAQAKGQAQGQVQGRAPAPAQAPAQAQGGAEARGGEQAQAGQESPRPLYIATDAPSLVRGSCLPACFAAFTWRDFVPTLRPHAPAPELLVEEGEQGGQGGQGGKGTAEYSGCSPYWVTAVDTVLMERARRVVYSDTSNVGRTVAVARRRDIGPEPMRFLMSLGVQPPLPPNVSAAQLEAAFFKGNASSARPATPPSAWASRAAAHLRRTSSSLLAAQQDATVGHEALDLRPWGDTTVDAAALARLQQLVQRHDPERQPGCEDEHASYVAGKRGALRCESDI